MTNDDGCRTQWKSIGNAPTWEASNRIDVFPLGDLIEHDTVTDDCVCVPRVERIERADGSDGWMHIHWSLDGRPTEDARNA